MVVLEGADNGGQRGVGGQTAAQRSHVLGLLVVPVELQRDGKRVLELCLAEVVEEPLRRALQPFLSGGIAQRSHHCHLALHPVSLRLIDDGVVLLFTGSNECQQEQYCCYKPLTSYIILLTSHIPPPF